MNMLKTFYKKVTEADRFRILFLAAILVVGIIYSVLPHFVRYDTLKTQDVRYIPVTQTANFDIMNIQPGRFREILDGNILSGELDTYEYRNGPTVWPLFSATMIAPFILLTGSVFWGIILSDFFFPILIFLSLFFILHALTTHRWFSLWSAYVLVLFPQLPLLLPPSSLVELKILFFQLLPIPTEPPTLTLTYLARESFIPGGAFFILSLFFIYKTVAVRVLKKYVIGLAGILYGLLFYLYLYFYVFTTIFLGVFFLVLLISNKRQEALRIFFVGVVGLVVSIPFWINYYHLSHLPNYWELMERFGVEVGRSIKLFLWKTYLLFAAMAGGALWLGGKINKETGGGNTNGATNVVWHYFIVALALSGIVAYNINAIMGYFMQSDHWSGRVFLITEGIVWATLLFYFFVYTREKFRFPIVYIKLILILSFAIAASLTSNAVYTQVKENTRTAYAYTVSPNLMNSYEWLNNNTPVDSVVMSPSLETNIDLSVYSHNKIFLARAQTTLAPDMELLDRLYITYKLFEISSERLDEMFKSFYGVFYFFTSKYNSREPDASLRHWKYPVDVLPDEVRKELINEYEQYTMPKMVPYRVDYIFVGPREHEMGARRGSFGQYEKLYEQDGVVIYKNGAQRI